MTSYPWRHDHVTWRRRRGGWRAVELTVYRWDGAASSETWADGRTVDSCPAWSVDRPRQCRQQSDHSWDLRTAAHQRWTSAAVNHRPLNHLLICQQTTRSSTTKNSYIHNQNFITLFRRFDLITRSSSEEAGTHFLAESWCDDQLSHRESGS